MFGNLNGQIFLGNGVHNRRFIWLLFFLFALFNFNCVVVFWCFVCGFCFVGGALAVHAAYISCATASDGGLRACDKRTLPAAAALCARNLRSSLERVLHMNRMGIYKTKKPPTTQSVCKCENHRARKLI